MINSILHAADIGSAVRPFLVNDSLSKLVHREFAQVAADEGRLLLGNHNVKPPVLGAEATLDRLMVRLRSTCLLMRREIELLFRSLN